MVNELSLPHKRLGRRIRELRLERGVTQEDLAYKIGISLTHMGYLERGQRNLNIDKVFRIAKALKVKPGDLFKGL